MPYEVKRFGTLYLGRKPMPSPQNPRVNGDIPTYQNGLSIVIGDTIRDQEITWLIPSGMNIYIADRCILSDVSPSTLLDQRLGYGRVCIIDDGLYRCRLLRADQRTPQRDEWLTAIKAAGVNKQVWNNNDMQFICIDIEYSLTEKGRSQAVTYGSESGDDIGTIDRSMHAKTVGYRPALEPMGSLTRGPDLYLDNQRFRLDFAHGTQNTRGRYGIKPILTPVQESEHGGKVVFQPEAYKDIKNGTAFKMYTFLMDGEPVRQDRSVRCKKGSLLELTDKFYGEEYLLKWSVTDGMAFGTRNMLSDVDLEDLKAQLDNRKEAETYAV